ncbi:MAG: hypothetical protein LBB94_01330, partial [Clostridiales bacterium]|nr:hypothetical protein [Clostridiales bacterium]
AGVFTDDDNRLMEIVSENLGLTFAMRQKLRQVCGQAKIRGVNTTAALSESTKAPALRKIESKAAFAGLISRLSEGE